MVNKDKDEKDTRKKDDRFINGVLWLIGWMILFAIVLSLTFKSFDKANEITIVNAFEFAGSFGGAILGAGVSLIILSITLIRQRRDAEEQREVDKRIRREDMLNSSRPVLKVQKYKTVNGAADINRFYYEASGTETHNDICLNIKNIGTGPARGITIKLGDDDLLGENKIKQRFDLGVGECEAIKIFTDYSRVLKEDTEKNRHAKLYVSCRDIYNERQYDYKVKLMTKKGFSHIMTIELIEEKISEVLKEES
ncbi:hypothetical protein [Clostridium sp.]|uniref:hypothetical protein n=1 Tax=Clostridium sp. TaxID=1506 RepID=UPI00290D77E1|nr:hypothetical protein [Clostridium sp.]MDU3323780.1 hypothetical protein [Escherichia coli]MDU3411004.1 hypothetical protein [Clostridium sp.]